jgi:protease I
MKTVALVIAEQIFRDEEYEKPKEILEEKGIRVLTASTTLGKAFGKLGMVVKPDILIKDLRDQALDALIFIGGGGSSQYFNDVTAHETAKFFNQPGKVIGAICIAPVILANAGLLKGRKATVFPDGKDALKAGGATYTGSQVEIDRSQPKQATVITGCGPEASTAFGEALVELLVK